MCMQDDIPKMKKSSLTSKITIYFPKEVEHVYRVGKQNGWDVSEIVRRAAIAALLSNADALNTPAEE